VKQAFEVALTDGEKESNGEQDERRRERIRQGDV
jgi:ribosome-associated protein YbcJ (S4-like RNA binding protein)